MSEQSISQLLVKDLIASIGSDHAAPGAGAAGAVTLALAAACASKAISVSLKHHPGETELLAAGKGCAEIARRALSDADLDAEAFESFIRARSPSKAALLVQTGEKLARLIDAMTALIEKVEPRIVSTVAGDLVAARVLAEAARTIQAHNEAEAKAERG